MATKTTLTDKQNEAFKNAIVEGEIEAYPGEYYTSALNKAQLTALREKYLVVLTDVFFERRMKLTTSGREYAIAQGWIAAPKTDEPQATADNSTQETNELTFKVGDFVEICYIGVEGFVIAIMPSDSGEYSDLRIKGLDGKIYKALDFDVISVTLIDDKPTTLDKAHDDDISQPAPAADWKTHLIEQSRATPQNNRDGHEQLVIEQDAQIAALTAKLAMATAALEAIARPYGETIPPTDYSAGYKQGSMQKADLAQHALDRLDQLKKDAPQ